MDCNVFCQEHCVIFIWVKDQEKLLWEFTCTSTLLSVINGIQLLSIQGGFFLGTTLRFCGCLQPHIRVVIIQTKSGRVYANLLESKLHFLSSLPYESRGNSLSVTFMNLLSCTLLIKTSLTMEVRTKLYLEIRFLIQMNTDIVEQKYIPLTKQ